MPLFPGAGGGGRRHYEVLEIQPNASLEEIKRAYRRLALQHHPDKGGNTDRFKEISTAHKVLSDPQKREIYDKYGDEGLSFMESGFFGEEGSEILPYIMNPRFYMVVMLVALLLLSIVVLVPVFIVVQTQHAVHWNWGVVFIPIWILLTLYIACTVAYIFVTKNSKIMAARFTLQAILVTLFFAFICARLDGTTDWDAGAYLAPLYAIEALNIFLMGRKSTRETYNHEMQGGEDVSKRWFLGLGYPGFVFRQWYWWLIRVWFLAFLTAQLDDGDWSWWIPAVPLVVGMWIGYIFKIADDKVAAAQSAADEQGEEGEERKAEKGGACMTSTLLCLLLSLAMIFLGFLATHLNNGKFSMAVVFIPIFIVLGLLVCCCFCCVPCFCCCFMSNVEQPLGEDGVRGFMPDFMNNRQRLLLEPSPSLSHPSSPSSSAASPSSSSPFIITIPDPSASSSSSQPAASSSSSASRSQPAPSPQPLLAHEVAPIPVIIPEPSGPVHPPASPSSEDTPVVLTLPSISSSEPIILPSDT